LAQVYAALAYYHANRQAIEADLEAEANLYDKLAEEHRLNRRRRKDVE